MKSINLLLLSSTITLISATLLQPVIAQPSMALHQLKVAPAQMISTKQVHSTKAHFINLPSNPINSMLNQNMNNIDYNASSNVSSRLALSSVKRAAEQLPGKNINNLHSRNNFFENAMIFNDKMQQFISYFNKNNSLSKQTNTTQQNHQVEVKDQQKECNA